MVVVVVMVVLSFGFDRDRRPPRAASHMASRAEPRLIPRAEDHGVRVPPTLISWAARERGDRRRTSLRRRCLPHLPRVSLVQVWWVQPIRSLWFPASAWFGTVAAVVSVVPLVGDARIPGGGGHRQLALVGPH